MTKQRQGKTTPYRQSRLIFLIIGILCLVILTCAGCSNLSTLPNLRATSLALTQSAKEEQGLLATAEALATRLASSPIETAKAYATQQSPGYVSPAPPTPTPTETPIPPTPAPTATPTASPTPTTSNPGSKSPADIPIPPGEKTDFFSTLNFVSYTIRLDFNSIVEFYEKEMIVNGWSKVTSGSYQTADAATLIYEKPDRKANISIRLNPVSEQTIVVITITNK